MKRAGMERTDPTVRSAASTNQGKATCQNLIRKKKINGNSMKINKMKNSC